MLARSTDLQLLSRALFEISVVENILSLVAIVVLLSRLLCLVILSLVVPTHYCPQEIREYKRVRPRGNTDEHSGD